MRLKELIYLLGFQPRIQTWGHEVRRFELPDGAVDYAQWLHPGESRKEIRAADVESLREFLAPGDFCVDIGAHSGDTTVPMALAVGPQGTVLALEPNRYVFPVLEANARLNPERTHIVPLRLAAAENDGPLEFEYSDSGFCNGGRHQGISKWRHGHAFQLKVEGVNLAELLQREHAERLPRWKYLKVDTEGYDLFVLRTLRELLRRHRPFVQTEVYKHTSREYRRDLFEFLADLGYRVHRVEREDERRGETLTAERMSDWKHFDIFCVPE